MARKQKPDPKAQALAQTRTLNARPEAVRDEEFGSSEFFDARDVVQVKYEMDEVVAFARSAREQDPATTAAQLAAAIADRFAIRVHPRSVERALARAHNPKSGGAQ